MAEAVRQMRAERRLRAQMRLASAHKDSALCEVGLAAVVQVVRPRLGYEIWT